MPPAYREHYTAEDYRQWKGDWELIEGVAYAMAPSPTVSHQRVGFKNAQQLGERLETCKQSKPCMKLIGISQLIPS